MYFDDCKTAEELKSAYRKAAFANHPDRGGSESAMKAINAEYTKLWETLKTVHTSTRTDDGATYESDKNADEAPEEFINIIMALCKLDGISVELVGRWIWITGDTRKHKDTLKAIGCQWAPKKMAWYWHTSADAVKHGSNKSLNQIRALYGATAYTTADRQTLSAAAE